MISITTKTILKTSTKVKCYYRNSCETIVTKVLITEVSLLHWRWLIPRVAQDIPDIEAWYGYELLYQSEIDLVAKEERKAARIKGMDYVKRLKKQENA